MNAMQNWDRDTIKQSVIVRETVSCKWSIVDEDGSYGVRETREAAIAEAREILASKEDNMFGRVLVSDELEGNLFSDETV